MQARFYAPWYGRFLSPDPARDQHFEETQSWNIYSYVQNNPTMKIDPDGMAEKDVVQGAKDFLSGYVYSLANNLSLGAPDLIRGMIPNVPAPPDTQAANQGRLMGDIHGVEAGLLLGGGGAVAEIIVAPETGGASLAAIPATAAWGLGVVAVSGKNGIKDAVSLMSGGPKSAESPGQSSSGHPTDKYGNKLGGSGKPQEHTAQHSSKKAAKDAARSDGKGKPLKHASPQNKKQGPHFHPVDKKGEKVPTTTHHEYPK